VIVGNRNAGKAIMTAVLTVLLAMIVITAVVTWRRKSAPERQPPLPLHPSLLLIESAVGETPSPQLAA
jgi:hypothetical protein